jgi:hypothetical protein
VIKASREARQKATTLLEEAASQVVSASPEQWSAWCVHLLKAIDIRVDDEPYRAALGDIQAEIAARLESGRWNEHPVEAEEDAGQKDGMTPPQNEITSRTPT